MPPKSSSTSRVRARSNTDNTNNKNGASKASKSNSRAPSNTAAAASGAKQPRSSSKRVSINLEDLNTTDMMNNNSNDDDADNNSSTNMNLLESSAPRSSQKNSSDRGSSPVPLSQRSNTNNNTSSSSSGGKKNNNKGKNNNNQDAAATADASSPGGTSILARTRARREQERKEREAREAQRLAEENALAEQQRIESQRQQQVLDADVDTSNSTMVVETSTTGGKGNPSNNNTATKKRGGAAGAGGATRTRNNTTANNNNKTSGGIRSATTVTPAVAAAQQNKTAFAFNRTAALSEETHLKKLLPEEVATCNSYELIIKAVCEQIAIRNNNQVDDLATRLRQVVASLKNYLDSRVPVRRQELEEVKTQEPKKKEVDVAPVSEDAAMTVADTAAAAAAAAVASANANNTTAKNNNNDNNTADGANTDAAASTTADDNTANADDEDIPLFAVAAAAKVEKVVAERVAEQKYQEALNQHQYEIKVATYNLETVQQLGTERVQAVSTAIDKMEEEWKSDEMYRLQEELDEDLVHPVAYSALSQINSIQGHLNPGPIHVVTEKQKQAKKAKLEASRAKKEQLEKQLEQREAKKNELEEKKKKKNEEAAARKKALEEKKQKLNELQAAKQAAQGTGGLLMMQKGKAAAKKIMEDNDVRGKPILDAVVYKPAPLGHLFPRILRTWVLLGSFCKVLKVTQMNLNIYVKWVIDRPFERSMVSGDAAVAKDICRGLSEAIYTKNRNKLNETKEIFDEKNYSKDHVWLLHCVDVVESESKRRAAAAVRLRNFRKHRSQMTERQRRALQVKEKAAENAEKKNNKGKKRVQKQDEQEEDEDEDSSEEEDSDEDEEEEEEDDDDEEEEEDDDEDFEVDADAAAGNPSSSAKKDDDEENVEKLPEEIFAEQMVLLGSEICDLKPVRWHSVSPGRRLALIEGLFTLFLDTDAAHDAANTISKDLQSQNALLDKRLKDIQDECDKAVKEINKNEELKANPEEMKDKLLKTTKKRDKDIATATSNFNFRYLKDSDLGCRALPLGRDRFKRLYWLFPAESKIFVETLDGETDMSFPLERVPREADDENNNNENKKNENEDEEEEEEDEEEALLRGKNSNKNYEWGVQSPLMVTPSPVLAKPVLLDDEDAASPSSARNSGTTTAATTTKNAKASNATKKTAAAENDPLHTEAYPDNIWGFVPFERAKELIKQLDQRGMRESQLRKNLEKSLSMMEKVADQQSVGPRMMTRSRAQHDGYENRFRLETFGHRSYF